MYDPPQGLGLEWIHQKWLEGFRQYLGTPVRSGSFTMDADASTTITDTNALTTSKITITPTNAAAANLVAGASSPFVTSKAAGSFHVDTADAGSAAGTETFDYQIGN